MDCNEHIGCNKATDCDWNLKMCVCVCYYGVFVCSIFCWLQFGSVFILRKLLIISRIFAEFFKNTILIILAIINCVSTCWFQFHVNLNIFTMTLFTLPCFEFIVCSYSGTEKHWYFDMKYLYNDPLQMNRLIELFVTEE